MTDFPSFPYNDLNELRTNPEFITLINSIKNSGFIPAFRARSNRQAMTKMCLLRVLT